MRFDVDLAEIRFGYGLAPGIAPPLGTEAMLDGLKGPDAIAQALPIEPFEVFLERYAQVQEVYRIRRENPGTVLAEQAKKRRQAINKQGRLDAMGWAGQALLRAAFTPTAFRERLVAFWADHFTAYGRVGVARSATAPYIESAIRPNISGRFADLLEAAVMHPLMLHYLDQDRSIGPGSRRAIKSGGKLGLNENLAREVLELHTIGVAGPYTQKDVRQLAELFTGMTLDAKSGLKFRKGWAEPGPETVLGVTYDARPGLQTIRQALQDLSVHAATAAHIARKLVVHFVSDTPDADLVATTAARFLETDGDLMATYAAMLAHPASWAPELRNIKPPTDFVASSMRALSVDPARIQSATPRQLRRGLLLPLAAMGQTWHKPNGPDGWDEADAHWLTPQGLARRTEWAMRVPIIMRPDLPDPRAFVDTALGSYAGDHARFAANAAESRTEAIGLVLLSPAFQRR